MLRKGFPIIVETTSLVSPACIHLPGFVQALQAGWSDDNMRDVTSERLAEIERDPAGFIVREKAPTRQGPSIPLPDGSEVARLPGMVRWILDDGFAGSIGLRWQDGTDALPAHVLGHIGYAVVPWKRGRGIATRALALMLPLARGRGLSQVELTTTPDNLASRRVIEANGGKILETFEKSAAYGGGMSLRYIIRL